jgi:hypothetical protein
VTTSLASGACTFVPDIACSPGSGHHVLVIRISRCDGQAFSIQSKEANNGEKSKNLFGDMSGDGFLGFMSCGQPGVKKQEQGCAQMGLHCAGLFGAGGRNLTWGFEYNPEYDVVKYHERRSHSVRFDLFCGRSDTRVCDFAVDGLRPYASPLPHFFVRVCLFTIKFCFLWALFCDLIFSAAYCPHAFVSQTSPWRLWQASSRTFHRRL